ncbi:hypothetical protein C5167_016961 [Papaver somniferum]|uniref:Uncharacterized protein n=1 Tax=Papaver somniferum TaxID=3469 RepID=A0A4Y7II21_PAPSO|nr:hypothetical protein C5167_016961 [Papaver somniferum]
MSNLQSRKAQTTFTMDEADTFAVLTKYGIHCTRHRSTSVDKFKEDTEKMGDAKIVKGLRCFLTSFSWMDFAELKKGHFDHGIAKTHQKSQDLLDSHWSQLVSSIIPVLHHLGQDENSASSYDHPLKARIICCILITHWNWGIA